MYTVDELNDKLIDLAFSEDIGDGDHTTLCCIPEDAMGKSRLLIKEEGILAGMRIAKEIFHRFDDFMRGFHASNRVDRWSDLHGKELLVNPFFRREKRNFLKTVFSDKPQGQSHEGTVVLLHGHAVADGGKGG